MKKFLLIGLLLSSSALADCKDGVPADAKGVPFTPNQIVANPYLLSTWLDKCSAEEFRAKQAEINAMSTEQQVAAQLGIIARELLRSAIP